MQQKLEEKGVNLIEIKMKRKAALELSVGTIVIVILAMAMLILGIVLVRTIMCGAIGMTGEINNKVKGEIEKMFTGGEEVVCIGQGTTVVSLSPGTLNIVYCGIKAPETALYDVKVTGITVEGVSEQTTMKWVISTNWHDQVSPGDNSPKKVLRLQIPENAPEKPMFINLQVRKNNELILTPSLDFIIKRNSWFAGAVC